jgi:hypothetical protein
MRQSYFSHRQLAGLFVAGLLFIFPICGMCTPPAMPSRVLNIRFHGPEKAILADFIQAGKAVGMECTSVNENELVQCDWGATDKTGLRGLMDATQSSAIKIVTIRVYSSNVSTPSGEVDPDIGKALDRFLEAISRDAAIESVEQCVGIEYRCSDLHIHS